MFENHRKSLITRFLETKTLTLDKTTFYEQVLSAIKSDHYKLLNQTQKWLKYNFLSFIDFWALFTPFGTFGNPFRLVTLGYDQTMCEGRNRTCSFIRSFRVGLLQLSSFWRERKGGSNSFRLGPQCIHSDLWSQKRATLDFLPREVLQCRSNCERETCISLPF